MCKHHEDRPLTRSELEDGLAASRGIVLAVVVSLVLWAAVAAWVLL